MQLKKIIKSKIIILISIVIALFIEIFICNFPYFRTLFQENNNIKTEYTFNNSEINISNINERITSINIIYDNNLTDKITYELSYIAKESIQSTEINPKVILKDDIQYIHFDTHSKCNSINIKLKTNNDNLKIKSIILNKPNLNIEILRIIIIFTITIFILKIKNKSIYQQEYSINNKIQNNNFKINLFIFFGFITIYTFCNLLPKPFLIEKDKINKEDSILMQTESIMNGQIHLTETPSKELIQMKDSYDYHYRKTYKVDYLFDTAYYNKKYYNYFGIAPIITSILPFRLITGSYMHTHIFNLIYIILSILSLYSLYKKLINKYIKKISLCNFYLGFYTILFSSNILTLLRGQKYDIVITCGITFLLISLNLAISINDNKKYKKLKLILLGITSALIVLSKPTFIINYPLILFFLLKSYKNINI